MRTAAGTGSFAHDGPKVSVDLDAAILSTHFWRNAVFVCAGHVAIKRP